MGIIQIISRTLNSAYNVFQEQGFLSLFVHSIKFSYTHVIRIFIPTKDYTYWNDIKVSKAKYGDSFLPWNYRSNRPKYEEALISSIRDNVTENDYVGIIGGGFGISSVAAAKKTNNTISVYEASASRIKYIYNSSELNNVEDIIDINHALVGPDVHVSGTRGGASKIHPRDLPEFDILEMDCEGAEIDILNNLNIRPRLIIVETHAIFKSPEHKVKTELESLGYEIIDRGVEDDEKGVYVLTAKHIG